MGLLNASDQSGKRVVEGVVTLLRAFVFVFVLVFVVLVLLSATVGVRQLTQDTSLPLFASENAARMTADKHALHRGTRGAMMTVTSQGLTGRHACRSGACRDTC